MKAFAWSCMAILFLAGCTAAPSANGEAAQNETEEVYQVLKVIAQPKLRNYCRLAVLVDGEVANWSNEEVEKTFKAEYQQAFPEQKVQFVERADTKKVLAQAKEGEVPPVEAIVSIKLSRGEFGTDPVIYTALDIRIVDCKSGACEAYVTVICDPDKAAAEGACRKAVMALKAELEKSR